MTEESQSRVGLTSSVNGKRLTVRAEQPGARAAVAHPSPPVDRAPDLADAGLIRRHGTLLGAAAILIAGSAIRASMVVQDGLGYLPDTNFFVNWTRSLFQHGLGGFYEATGFCDYPPLFVLVMWGLGQGIAGLGESLSNEHLLRAVLKIPACLADLAIAITLLAEGRRVLGGRLAVAAAALYFLNPVSIYNSAYWGQVDAIHTAFILLSVVGMARGRWGLAGSFMAFALLQKFQSIAFVPLLLFEAYRYRRWQGLGYVLVGATVVAAWVLLPFALSGALPDVLQRGYLGVVGQYSKLSPSAYNVWHLVASPGLTDTALPETVLLAAADGRASLPADGSPLLWLSWRNLSLVAYTLGVALVLTIYSYRPGPIARAGAAGLLGLAFFLIPTEMHERYAHPAIAMLALWAVTGPWKERLFLLLSTLMLLNLTKLLPADQLATHIAAILVSLFIIMLVWMGLSKRRTAASPGAGRDAPQPAPEVKPRPSLIVTWFRRLTYVAVVGAFVGGGLIAHAARDSRAMVEDENTVYLSELSPVRAKQGWGTLQRDHSVGRRTIRMGDTVYLRGLGTHTPSTITFEVPAGYDSFVATVGIDKGTNGRGRARASVELDGREVFRSPVLSGADADQVTIDVPLGAASRLTLKAEPTADGRRFDHVNWALAAIVKAR